MLCKRKKGYHCACLFVERNVGSINSILKDKTIYGNQYTNAVIDLFGDKTSSTLLNSYVDWIGMSLETGVFNIAKYFPPNKVVVVSKLKLILVFKYFGKPFP